MSLPEWYKEWIDRVSNIVSFVFPFDWNSKKRYLDWLELNWINEDEYLKEAQDVWTFVHLQLEKKVLKKRLQKSKPLFNLHQAEIEFWIEYLEWLDGDFIPEKVVIDSQERYQGTIDLVRIDEKNKKVWLYDWKTWGIAKKKYWLPNKYKKPYDKIKKVALQLSLYAEYYRNLGYTVEWIYVLWLHETGCYEYELELYSTRKLNHIIRAYQKAKNRKIQINHISDMIIELRKPTEQYGYINITIDMYKEQSWKTKEELIEEWIDAINYIVNKK